MGDSPFQQYKELGISNEILNLVNRELKLPDERLTAFARGRRVEALNEALSLEKGPDQEHRKSYIFYKIGDFTLGVAKPGKEAAPDYKSCRHYITHEKTNNPNDMFPLVLKSEKKFGKELTFELMFEKIEHLMRSDLFGLELMGMLLFRAAFMLDHQKNKDGHWRYQPPEDIVKLLEKKIPDIEGMPVRVFLHFLEILSLNEDVKVHTLGYEGFKQDYGRINTLLTFAHLIIVLIS
ncbi:unnamed protein product, partial [marine sediment metagenome]